jgi:hypothetical protein
MAATHQQPFSLYFGNNINPSTWCNQHNILTMIKIGAIMAASSYQ